MRRVDVARGFPAMLGLYADGLTICGEARLPIAVAAVSGLLKGNQCVFGSFCSLP
jgi:hypothetical protein